MRRQDDYGRELARVQLERQDLGALMVRDDGLVGVRGLLTQWGRWVRSGGSGVTSYRCPLGSLRGGGVPIPAITDDVAKMKHRLKKLKNLKKQ